VAAFGFAAAMLTDDDDELDEENRNVNNVRFKIGDKRVSIPLSYGLIGFTHYLGRSVAMALKGEDVSLQSLRLASALITNTAPVNPIPNPDRLDGTNAIIGMMPTPLEFPASVFLNRNSFGSDMRPDYNDNPDAYKAFRGTRGSVYADIAAFLNENTGGTTRESGFIDVSPETLKGFMHFTLGGTGKFVADSASTTRDLLDGGGLNENNVPLLNRFVKTEDVSTYRARFYRQAGEAKDKLELYNKYLKDGNSEKRRELAPWVILGRRGNMMWKQMNAIRDRELKISRDDTLTTAERDAQLKALADKQIDLSEKYHRLYKRKTEGA
jgi:hypothetical protein